LDNIYNIEVNSITGESISMSTFQKKVLLIVNTASKCGFTPQYSGLEELYQKYKDSNFLVLGFPCNQFGSQEPGSESEIQKFCTDNYSISFPMFKKIDVNGVNTHPLYKYLKTEAPGMLGFKDIKWNFTKFLVQSDGKVITRYAPATNPSKLSDEIRKLLN